MVYVIAQKIILCVGETFTLPPHRHTINSKSNRYTLIYTNSSSILLSQVTIHFSCYLSQPEPDPDRPPVSIPLYIRHVASLLGWEHSIRSKYRAIVAQLSPARSHSTQPSLPLPPPTAWHAHSSCSASYPHQSFCCRCWQLIDSIHIAPPNRHHHHLTHATARESILFFYKSTNNPSMAAEKLSDRKNEWIIPDKVIRRYQNHRR